MFKILCLDGGGARGYFTAYMLKKIEEEYNIKIFEYFDLIVGTSTGALIAGAVSLDTDIQDIIDLYINENEKIFKKKYKMFNKVYTLFDSIYDNTYLKYIISKTYNSKNFKDVKTNLIITATNLKDKTPVIFRSWENNDISLIDAVIASASAPIFFDPHIVGEEIYCDGCLWANNPSLLALSEAIDKNSFNKKIGDIKILSIGTGKSKKSINDENSWGMINWSNKIVDLSMTSNVISVSDMTSKILQDKFLRIDFKTKHSLSLDKIPKFLVNNIDKIFENNKNNLDEFFKKEKQNFLQNILKKLFRL